MPTDTTLQTALNADWARVATTNGTAIVMGEGASTILVTGTPTSINGGASGSALNYASVAGGVTVHLDTGTDSFGDTIANVHNVTGSAGADTIYGTTASDSFTGGAGADTLIGNGGADTYVFASGAGADTIVNGVTTSNVAAGRVIFGAGQDPSKLWFSQSGNDLKISVIGTTDQLTLKNWFSGAYAQVASMQLADGSSITAAAVTGLASAMTSYQAAHTTFNPQTATAMPSDTTLQAALNIGWARNYTTAGTAINVVEGSATVSVSGKVTAINGGAGPTTLSYTGATGVTVHLDTGTDSYGDTLSNIHSVTGTSAADTIYGTTLNDTLSGGAGSDTLIGNGGTDTYKFSSGNGLETIINGVSTGTAPLGILSLGAGLNPSRLWFVQSGNDLKIDVIGSSTDQVTLQGWFSGAYAQLSAIQFVDGSSIPTAKISLLITAMATYQTANPSFNPQTATVMPTDTTLQTALNADWARVATTNGTAIVMGEGASTILISGTPTSINGGASGSALNYASLAGGVTVHLDTGTDNFGDTISNVHNVTGSAGADTIYGTTTSDDLTGGLGNDTLIGNGGSDTYRFAAGAGADTIINGVSTSNTAAGRLILGVGQDPSKLWFVQSGNDLKIEVIGSPTDQVTLQNWFSGAYAQLATLQLSDGSSITAAAINGLTTAMAAYQTAHTSFNAQTSTTMPTDATLQTALNTGWTRGFTTAGTAISVVEGNAAISVTGKATTIDGGIGASKLTYSGSTGVTVHLDTGTDSYGDTLSNVHAVTGTAGADTIYGTTGSDILNGGAGSDTLIGGGGNDTYDFNTGNGLDTIQNGVASNNTAAGTLLFGSGLAHTKLWFVQSGNDLKIDVVGSTTDQVTIQGWFSGSYEQLTTITAGDGYSINAANVASLTSAMASYQAAHATFNPQTATSLPSDTNLQAAVTSDWSTAASSSSQAQVTAAAVHQQNAAIAQPETPSNTYDYGDGDYNVSLTGEENTVTFGKGTDSLAITDGGKGSINGGDGDKTISIDGSNNSVTLGNGSNTITETSLGVGNTFDLTAGNTSMHLLGTQDQVFISGGSAVIYGQTSQLSIHVSDPQSIVEIADFSSSQALVLDLTGGIGGYGSSQSAFDALQDDGNGNVSLALGSTGQVIFDHIQKSDLSVSNFHVSQS